MTDQGGRGMTREEREAAISYLETYRKSDEKLFKMSPRNSVAHHATAQCLKYWNMAIEALKQEPCEDAVSRAEVLNLVRFNAFHVKSQIKAIENMPSVTPQEPFINKPCVSSGVCEHDKNKALDKIRAEIEQEYTKFRNRSDIWNERACGIGAALEIIDKYKAESEDKE